MSFLLIAMGIGAIYYGAVCGVWASLGSFNFLLAGPNDGKLAIVNFFGGIAYILLGLFLFLCAALGGEWLSLGVLSTVATVTILTGIVLRTMALYVYSYSSKAKIFFGGTLICIGIAVFVYIIFTYVLRLAITITPL